MDTWIVFATASSYPGPVDQLQRHLIEQAGRDSEPGVEPEAVLLANGSLRVRQSFPMVSAWQAVQLASESLRRILRPEQIVRIEAVRLGDWQRAQH